MKISVHSLSNKKVKDVELPDVVCDYPYKEHLIHLAVKSHLAAQRAGTHKTKSRGEIVASGRKPWRQKGTGRSRAGTASSPLWRKGATTHGPRPRSYKDGLSAREKRNALRSAFARKLREDGVVVLDSLELENHKTGELAKALQGLGVTGKALVVDSFDNDNLHLAARNNPRLKSVDALAVNVYDIVDRPHFVVSEGALGRIVEVLSR